MAKCWIIGRNATLAPNGHEYVAEPFIVFLSEEAAKEAADMVEKVSGERPKIVEGALHGEGKKTVYRDKAGVD